MAEERTSSDPEIEEYLALSSAKEGSLVTYRSQLTELRRRLGKPLKSATLTDLARLKRGLRDDGRRSAPYYLRTLRGFYKRYGLNDLADASREKIRAVRLRPDAILLPADVKRLIEAAGSKRDAALIGALWDTGGRVSELLALNLGDVKEQAGAEPPRYTLWFHTVKGDDQQHEGFILDTSTTFRAWLKAHPFRNPSAPVFCGADGSRMGRKRAWSMLRETAERAQVSKHVHPHLFRHSRATALLRMHVPEADVKKLLGWSPGSQQLTRYSHLTSRDALRSLLVANGQSLPPEDQIGRVQVDVEKLVPVVPVPANPTRPALSFTLSPAEIVNSIEWAKANEDLVRRTTAEALAEFKKKYLDPFLQGGSSSPSTPESQPTTKTSTPRN